MPFPRSVLALGLGLVAGSPTIATVPASSPTSFFQQCEKIWSHRALGAGGPENSVEGMLRAFALGAGGVEIDVIFEPRRSEFYVISEELAAQGAPAELVLSDLLLFLPVDRYAWLDFWNLKGLSVGQSARAIDRLKKILDAAGLRKRTIVESQNAYRLAAAAAAGLNTSLWINVAPDGDAEARGRHLRDVANARNRFRAAAFSAVSMDFRQYSRDLADAFRGIPIHLFTINDRASLIQFADESQVKIILTDQPFFQDFGCSRPMK